MRRQHATDQADSPILGRKHRPDYKIALYMGLLMMLGLVVMYAIGPQRAVVLNNSYGTDFYDDSYFFIKQTISLVLAFVAFTVMAMVPYKLLQRHTGKILAAGFIACVLLMFFGNILHMEAIVQCSLGACRWFELGPLGSLQPAEFLKLGILLYAAGFLGTRANQGLVNDRSQTLMPLAIVVGVAVLFIVIIQKDMGTGISLVALLATMLFMAGISFRTGALISLVLLVGAVLSIAVAPHRIERISTFFSGDSSQLGDAGAYHITHAKIAIGSGGLTGVGIGNSVQATGYLPEAINDSVFAIMGETFGFAGLVAVLALFTALLMRILRVSDHLPDKRLQLIAVGVFGWLGAHVILNVGAMTGIIPLTGITLPLLSFGGTSMVFIAAALGIVFQLSRYTMFGSKLKGNDYEDSQRRRGLRGPRYSGRRRSR